MPNHLNNMTQSFLIKLILLILLFFVADPTVAQHRRFTTNTGYTFYQSKGHKLDIVRKGDFEKASITNDFNGVGFHYSTSTADALYLKFGIGEHSRISSLKLFSADASETTINEKITQYQIGLENYFKVIWGMQPFTAVNYTVFQISLSIKSDSDNLPADSETTTSTEDTSSFVENSINQNISSQVSYPNYAFGVDIPFKVTSIRFFIERFPTAFQAGDKIDTNYDYAYYFQGNTIGLSFIIYL